MNILFVCSRNKWRSPTAEVIYKNRSGLNVRSAGTEPSARIRISSRDIEWADLIFAMEKRHRQRLEDKYPQQLNDKRIVVLDIEDEYQFMDIALIEIIKLSVDPFLE
jgi:predicted protein tyrosine phosphatase